MSEHYESYQVTERKPTMRPTTLKQVVEQAKRNAHLRSALPWVDYVLTNFVELEVKSPGYCDDIKIQTIVGKKGEEYHSIDNAGLMLFESEARQMGVHLLKLADDLRASENK